MSYNFNDIPALLEAIVKGQQEILAALNGNKLTSADTSTEDKPKRGRKAKEDAPSDLRKAAEAAVIELRAHKTSEAVGKLLESVAGTTDATKIPEDKLQDVIDAVEKAIAEKEEAAPTHTRDEMNEAVRKVRSEIDKDTAVKIINEVGGVGKLAEIPDDKIDAVFNAAADALADKI